MMMKNNKAISDTSKDLVTSWQYRFMLVTFHHVSLSPRSWKGDKKIARIYGFL